MARNTWGTPGNLHSFTTYLATEAGRKTSVAESLLASVFMYILYTNMAPKCIIISMAIGAKMHTNHCLIFI